MSKNKKNTAKKISKKKATTTALVGASLAAVAAGAYISYRKGRWPFGAKKAGRKADGDRVGNGKSAADSVDVALTNEVAQATMHNPNNAGDFVDEGGTGNAD